MASGLSGQTLGTAGVLPGQGAGETLFPPHEPWPFSCPSLCCPQGSRLYYPLPKLKENIWKDVGGHVHHTEPRPPQTTFPRASEPRDTAVAGAGRCPHRAGPGKI